VERLNWDLVELKKALKTLGDAFSVLEDAKKVGHHGFILAAEDSIIQRFEYTYESFWKFLKKYMEIVHSTEDINTSRRIFYASVKLGLCTQDEGALFLDMADDRNETSHTYNVEASRIILSDIPAYYAAMNAVVGRLSTCLATQL